MLRSCHVRKFEEQPGVCDAASRMLMMSPGFSKFTLSRRTPAAETFGFYGFYRAEVYFALLMFVRMEDVVWHDQSV